MLENYQQMDGSVIIPDMFRDMARHNVAAGRIVSMGPLAFWFKNGTGDMERHNVGVGDWVTIRPFAGTHVQGGKLQVGAGYRYVSSFQDVIGIIPADKMPDPAALIWDEEEETATVVKPAVQPVAVEAPRERVECVGHGPCMTRGACIANGKCAAVGNDGVRPLLVAGYNPSHDPDARLGHGDNACEQDEGA